MKNLISLGIIALPLMLCAMEENAHVIAPIEESKPLSALTREECADRMQAVVLDMEYEEIEENVPKHVQKMRELLDLENMNPNDIIKRFYVPPLCYCRKFITHGIPLFFEYHDAGKKKLEMNVRYGENLTPLLFAIEAGLRFSRFEPALMILNHRSIDPHMRGDHNEHPLHLLTSYREDDTSFPTVREFCFTLMERGAWINCRCEHEDYEESRTLFAEFLAAGGGAIQRPLALPTGRFSEATPFDMVFSRRSCVGPLLVSFGAALLKLKDKCDLGKRDKPQDAYGRFGDLLWFSDKNSANFDECCKIVTENQRASTPLFIDEAFEGTPGNSTTLTPCMIAAARNHPPLLRALIYHGADINALAQNQWTALHFAAYNGHGDVVRVLLSQPGITTCPRTNKRAWMGKDAKGLSPYDLAIIGHEARKQGNEHTNDTAIQVLDEFCYNRKYLALMLKKYVGVPQDVAKMIAINYRFSNLLSAEGKSESPTISTERQNINNTQKQ